MTDIQGLLGDEADSLLTHVSKGIPEDDLTLPGPDFVDRVFADTDRSPAGAAQPASAVRPRPPRRHRLPVDPAGRPGHRALGGGVVRAQPEVLRPGEHRRARHRGRLQRRGLDLRRARRCARGATRTRSRSSCKLNHNELLTYPNKFDQIMFGSVEQAYDLGAAGVGATIYFGSRRVAPPDPARSARPSSRPTSSACSPCCGATCATTPSRQDGVDYHAAADLTGQANHLGVTIEADIIKQKLPENNGGFNVLANFGKTSKLVYERADHRPPDRPAPAGRWSTATWVAIGLINSGGESHGRQRPGRGGAHRGHQQARRRHGPDQRAQGLPAADGRGRRAAQRHPGRLPRRSRSTSPDRQATSGRRHTGVS